MDMDKMRTLLYLASGGYQNVYDDLPYERIILVDRGLRTRITTKGFGSTDVVINLRNENEVLEFISDNLLLNGIIPGGRHKVVLELGMDAIPALTILIELKVKIDALVSINEGLWEGGGDYYIFSDLIMGLTIPLFNEKVTLVCDPNYYAHCRRFQQKFFKDSLWGCAKTEVGVEDADYLNPKLFSTDQREFHGNVFNLQKNRVAQRYSGGVVNVQLIKDSIWSDHNDLHLIVFPESALSGFLYGYLYAIDVLSARFNVEEWRSTELQDITLRWYREKNTPTVKGILGMVSHSFLNYPEDIFNLIDCLNRLQIPLEVRFYCLTDYQFERGTAILNRVENLLMIE
jgi:hypothetical protein